MSINQPFHEGETFVQERLGVAEEARRIGRVVGSSIAEGARGFLSQQTMAVVGSVDSRGEVWASMLLGEPGFLKVIDEKDLEIDLDRVFRDLGDPLWGNFQSDSRVGTLVIDLATRRRLRVNGRLWAKGSARLRLEVEEFYPNCPQYIQRRRLVGVDGGHGDSRLPGIGTHLGPSQVAFIRRADTFFVASAHPRRGVDASHRGGNPGFVEVLSDGRLRIPDFPGNRMYNTLGNFAVNPRAGLVFVDFETSRTLQLLGRVKIQWDAEDPDDESGGTRRFWDFQVLEWREASLARRFEWEFVDFASQNPGKREASV